MIQTADGGLALAGGRCAACGELSFPATRLCGNCLSEEIERVPLPSDGVLYSYSVVHVGGGAPYALGYVDLADGLRVLAHIGTPAGLACDAPVRLVVEAAGGDAYRFHAEMANIGDIANA